MLIRPAESADQDAIWAILDPVIRAGETYALPREMNRKHALGFWCAPANYVFVAEHEGQVAGTYFLRANQLGGGSHVANCGYVTAEKAQGKGVARQMLEHSLEQARER